MLESKSRAGVACELVLKVSFSKDTLMDGARRKPDLFPKTFGIFKIFFGGHPIMGASSVLCPVL
jgi:hypothetical protein